MSVLPSGRLPPRCPLQRVCVACWNYCCREDGPVPCTYAEGSGEKHECIFGSVACPSAVVLGIAQLCDKILPERPAKLASLQAELKPSERASRKRTSRAATRDSVDVLDSDGNCSHCWMAAELHRTGTVPTLPCARSRLSAMLRHSCSLGTRKLLPDCDCTMNSDMFCAHVVRKAQCDG